MEIGRHPTAFTGATLLVVLLVAALVAPYLGTVDPLELSPIKRLRPPAALVPAPPLPELADHEGQQRQRGQQMNPDRGLECQFQPCGKAHDRKTDDRHDEESRAIRRIGTGDSKLIIWLKAKLRMNGGERRRAEQHERHGRGRRQQHPVHPPRLPEGRHRLRPERHRPAPLRRAAPRPRRERPRHHRRRHRHPRPPPVPRRPGLTRDA